MTELSIKPKKKITNAGIEKICGEMGLVVTMKASLKSIAENTHWHFKREKQKGTLEITLMHGTGEVILSVHENRRGGWEEGVIKVLAVKFV